MKKIIHTFGQYVVVNPAIIGKTIAEISQDTTPPNLLSLVSGATKKSYFHKVSTVLENHDNLLVIANKDDVASMEILCLVRPSVVIGTKNK